MVVIIKAVVVLPFVSPQTYSRLKEEDFIEKTLALGPEGFSRQKDGRNRQLGQEE